MILEIVSELGLGLAQDYIESFAWYDIAVAQRFKNAIIRQNTTREKLSFSQGNETLELKRKLYKRISK